MTQAKGKMNRRGFLERLAACGLIATIPGSAATAFAGMDRLFLRVRVSLPMSFGVITDTHYGDLDDTPRPRYFRSSLDNIEEAADLFTRERVDFAVHMGDVIQESRNRTLTMEWLKRADDRFKKFTGPRHYVLGNHDLGDLTKGDFLATTSGEIKAPNYYFDHQGYRFITLDPNFRQDGVAYDRGNFSWTDTALPSVQMAWLQGALNSAKNSGRRVIVFSHQCLDPSSQNHEIKNAEEIRQLFEDSGIVDVVFYGHRHNGGYFNINDIHYVGIVATVNGPDLAAAIIRIRNDGIIEIDGRGNRQRDWGPFTREPAAI